MNMDIKEVESKTSKDEETQTEQLDTVDTVTDGTVSVPLTFLNSIKSVLEITIARGVYRANEIKVIGTLYESLENLITNTK